MILVDSAHAIPTKSIPALVGHKAVNIRTIEDFACKIRGVFMSCFGAQGNQDSRETRVEFLSIGMGLTDNQNWK
jgi:hypothetical protein